jgi:molybdopterin molybdotransferase
MTAANTSSRFHIHPSSMLELEEALARILALVPAPVAERAPLCSASGRVLAGTILSPIHLPAFDNSAMDGYAVRAGDVTRANTESPVRLRLCGRLAAGETFSGEVPSGACARLFTGSPLPGGADAVVMQEDTRVDPGQPDTVLVLAPALPGENVRRRGEDVKQGAVIAEAGERLTAGRVGLLAAVGLTDVSVGRQPVVSVLATGSELAEGGRPLAPGQIYESNRAALAALLTRCGAVPRMFPLVADTLAGTRAALEAAFGECDAVLTSGGVSVGEMDFVKAAFEQLGGKLDFWKVAIKPGRPFAFGQLGGKLLFGLPGNPVSAFVTFLLLVRPAIIRWQGAAQVPLPAHLGMLAEPLSNPGERRHFIRVKVDEAGNVHSAGIQGSHRLGSLAAANGLLEVPPQTTLAAGSTVRVMRWD